MVLPSSGTISLGQIATEYSDSQPNSMSEFYNGGGKVPTTLSGSATQAAPSSNGTYNDFGSVTGLTLVRTTPTVTVYTPGPGSSQYTSVNKQGGQGTGSIGSSNSYRLYYCARGYQEGGTMTITYSGGSTTTTYHTGGSLNPNHTLFQNGPYSITVNNQATISYRIYTYSTSTVYTFTNNTGYDVTIEGTTVANGASSAISPSGDFDISYTILANPNVPSSGTIDFADFYGGRGT